jgi:hypothetical protein
MRNRLTPKRRAWWADYTPEAKRVFDAFGSSPATAQRKWLIDQTIRRLKRSGLWDKLDCFYIFAAHASGPALINWKNPGTFNATLVNSPTFAVNRGFTTAAGTTYVDSAFTPSTAGGVYTQNSASIGARSLKAGAADNARLVGGATITPPRCFIIPTVSGNAISRLNNDTSASVATPGTDGFFVAVRTASTTMALYRNGASIATSAAASTGLPTVVVRFVAGEAAASDYECASGFIGAGLSAEDVAALSAIELAYMQAVGAV